ncbi:MAG: CAF17-like 4Fe-4S cluster assembly/insertion protein YgfZ [Telluria sp.]
MNNMNTLNDNIAPETAPVLTASELANGFVAVVAGQEIIAVTGDDAASFLHGQLTNDVQHLGQAEARLAGYCSPKGRLMASFLMWRNAESVFLQLPAELRPALQKRLSMFVMRAKARLSDVSADPANQVILGLGGAKAQAALQQLLGTLPVAPYTRIDHALGTVLRLADAFGAPRYQWLCSQDTGADVLPRLRETLAFGSSDAWRLSDIHAGIPQIMLATQEQFVPQMVNYELIGGVNFKKGCYPGQEIVARSQYLGKLKRRTALASIDSTDVAPGAEVFDVADPDQPCGMVVNAAPNGNGGVDALVEMKLVSLEQGDIRLDSAAGVPLRFQSMPYALDALDL